MAASQPMPSQQPPPQADLMPQGDPLAQLRDIHLPAPVSDFPAPGWWILSALLLVFGFVAIRWIIRKWRENGYRREGIRELNSLKHQFESNHDQRRYLQSYSALLKRLAMTGYPRKRVAALTGEEWVAFLDESSHGKGFSLGKGQILMYGVYEKDTEVNVDDLHQLGTHWIKEHRANYVA